MVKAGRLPGQMYMRANPDILPAPGDGGPLTGHLPLQVMYGMDYVNAEREQQHAYLRQTVMGHVQRHPQVGRQALLHRSSAAAQPATTCFQQLSARLQCTEAFLYGAVLSSHSATALIVIFLKRKECTSRLTSPCAHSAAPACQVLSLKIT